MYVREFDSAPHPRIVQSELRTERVIHDIRVVYLNEQQVAV